MKRRDALCGILAFAAGVPLSACNRRKESGQTERTWHVGLLLTGLTEDAVASQRRVIVESLARNDFVEGRNLRIEVRRGGYSRTEDAVIARELVTTQPDAILVDTGSLAIGAREATSTIPIVFTGVADPVAAGLIKDFARPGGNATGVHFSQLAIAGKRLELLRELLPGAQRVLVVRHLGGPESDALPHLHREASRLGIEIVETDAKWGQGFVAPPAFSSHGKPDAMYSGEPWIIYGAEYVADQIIRFAAEQRIPSLFWEAEAAERGATLAYGARLTRELGRAADQLARVLKGTKPGELSVDTATEYELVVNRKAAAGLGIAIPTSILARANRVIE